MARGQYYTRQQLNQLAQERISARNTKAAADKAAADKIANDPRRKELARLREYSTTQRAKYDKLYQETGKKVYADTSDSIRRKYQDKIRTVERAIKKDISISSQKSNEKSGRADSRARVAERQLVSKFGRDVYNEMSPEAKSTAYQQFFGEGYVPSRNTAAEKDAFNLEQEKVYAANKRAQELYSSTYKDVSGSFRTATAKEYFTYIKTGVDPRPKPVNRADYKTNAGYAAAVAQQSNIPRATVTGEKAAGGKLNYYGRAFQAGVMGDEALAADMGLSSRGGGAGNLVYQAGVVAYIPARIGAGKIFGRLVSGVTGAGYGAGSQIGTYAGSVGGRYTAAGVLGGKVGGFVGATTFAAPVIFAGGLGVLEASSAPVNRELTKRGIDPKEFRSAFAEARETTGGLTELNPLFTNKERFAGNFAASLQARGISSGSGVQQLAGQQMYASGVTDAFMLVAGGAAANVVGARLSVAGNLGTLYKTPLGTFSSGAFRQIGAAGVVEGGISSYGQNLAGFERFDPKRAALSAGVGGLSAGLLGGFVAGTAAAGQRTASSLYEGFGFAADPSEFGSDLMTAGNPLGNARGVFAASVPPLNMFQGGAKELQPPLSSFTDSQPAPRSDPVFPSGRRSRDVNPFVNPNINTNPLVEPFVPVDPVPVAPNPTTRTNPLVPSDPFVPVSPNPNVPVAPNPFVPVAPNPNVPSQPNPLVDVPVTKLFFPPLGRGSTIPRRSKAGFGSGRRKATYTASFAALELGISSSSPRTKGTFSGFEIRPFAAPSGRKKKKGKRTKGKARKRSKARKSAPFSLSLGASPV